MELGKPISALMRSLSGRSVFDQPDYRKGNLLLRLPPVVWVNYYPQSRSNKHVYVESREVKGWVYCNSQYNPIFTPYVLEQWADGFDNPVGPDQAGAKVWPGEWYDVSPFNKVYFQGQPNQAIHTGADLNLPNNQDRQQDIYAMASGIVVFSGRIDVWGHVVVIEHDPLKNTGQVVFSRIAHMHDVFVKRGERVRRGQRIATIGDAFGRFSDHLHLDISPTWKLAEMAGHWPKMRQGEMMHYVDPKLFIQTNRPGLADVVQPHNFKLDEMRLKMAGLL